MTTKVHTMAVLTLVFCWLANASAGIVGHWPFEEGAGDVAADSSGNGHSGSFEGSPQWVSPGWGDAGWCLQFGGSGDRLTVEPFDLEGTGITLAAWIKPATFSDDARIISKAEGSGTGDHYWAMILSGGGENNLEFRLRTNVGGASRYTTGDAYDLGADEWTHVTVTWDAGDPFMRQYKNGQEIRSDSKQGDAVATNSAVKIGIGNQSISVPANGNVRPFTSVLDEVLVVDRALTQGQIMDLMGGILPDWSKAMEPDPADGAIDVVTPLLTWTPGESAVLHDVYFGTDPNPGPDSLVQARVPTPVYYHATGITPGQTYYWRVDEIEVDMTTVHVGDVWSFLAQPLTAYMPEPADGANDVPPDPNMTLRWQGGVNAVEHHVYFGDSFEDVNAAAASADEDTTREKTFAPGPLQALMTYYWRVDEIDALANVQVGAVWSFTTCLIVDDFESYDDDIESGTTVFDAWTDGLTNGTGSYVGYEVSSDGTFGETQIVFRGSQSMPMEYDNSESPYYSEAEHEFATTRDFTADGIETLVLHVRGQSSNEAAPLYVGVTDSSNRTGFVTHPSVEATTSTAWIAWEIRLSEFADVGVELSRVKSMVIGLGDRNASAPGGAGRVYVDEIWLTRPAPGAVDAPE